MRFRILRSPCHYPFETQVKLVVALCVLHNIIRISGLGDDAIQAPVDRHLEEQEVTEEDTADEADMNTSYRDKIAETMWEQYLRVRNARRRTN
jgi:hypothetical protein